MDIKRLRAFISVANHAHFGRAAEHLNITQPGLTKRIRGLEQKIGTTLFDRDRQPINLTPLGRQLLPAAQRLVREADAFLLEARRSITGETGTLAIGFGLSTITLAPRIISRFRTLFPDVEVTMNDFSSREMVDRIRRDELDLGFVRFPVAGDLNTLALATDQLAIATPVDLTIEVEERLHQLTACNFVALRDERGPGLARQVRDWCQGHSFYPRMIQQADDIQTVLALVAAGLGCAIVPASSASLLSGQINLFLLPGEDAIWHVGAAWRHRPDIVGALAEVIRLIAAWPESIVLTPNALRI